MRKYIGYALIVVAFITLVVWVISHFVQPLLPGNINGGLILLFLAAVGVATFLGAIKDVAELMRNWFERPHQPEQPPSSVMTGKKPEAEKGNVEPVEMPLNPEQLKLAIVQRWHEFAINPAEAAKRVGVKSAYGLLIAAAYLPLLLAYTTNQVPTVIALTTIVSGVGSNLLASFIQKVFDRRLTSAQLEQLAKEDSEIEEVLDILLNKTGSVQAAQQALRDNSSVFMAQLVKELQHLKNSPYSRAIVSGKTIINDAATAVPINVFVQSGGQLNINGGFVHIHKAVKQSIFPTTARSEDSDVDNADRI